MPTSQTTSSVQPQHEPPSSRMTSPPRLLTKQTSEITPQSVRVASIFQRHTSMESSSPSRLKMQTKLHSPTHAFKVSPSEDKVTSPTKKIKKHLRQGFRLFANASYKDLREPEMQWNRVPAPPKDPRSDEPYAVWWVEDEGLLGCMICHVPFGMYFRRHHCRSCGDVVCSDCSKARKEIPGLLGSSHRVCDACMCDGTWVQPTGQETTESAQRLQSSDDDTTQVEWVEFNDPLPPPPPESSSAWGLQERQHSYAAYDEGNSSPGLCAPPSNLCLPMPVPVVESAWVADFEDGTAVIGTKVEGQYSMDGLDVTLPISPLEVNDMSACCGIRGCCVIS
ncbi:hypothetical protein H257_11470 [Aphanomyces astaci]|uniref:FYVE-type domain-containing protein n=1 Tax=Aphanomyces astaci TaxID=112090 RepID=W4G418_APHAT|nr:hypothetical protein H257_11470 [Aphanomyces astaci]ETV73779.1 hypothetical protein H257_11470 [Aphanomyces astaci]|eukprot:XP_009836715.1 hypothetical protein H257_11470 [Aphanomyces astaci]